MPTIKISMKYIFFILYYCVRICILPITSAKKLAKSFAFYTFENLQVRNSQIRILPEADWQPLRTSQLVTP